MRILSVGPLLLLLLPGCVNFHPLNPPWQEPDAVPVEAQAGRLLPEWRTVGYSVQGRPLRTMTLGSGARRVIWIGGIHGDEREGSVATAELPPAVQSMPWLQEQVTLTIVEDINPDGTALRVRTNAKGVDLNRNYPAANFKPHRMYGITPLSQPEAKALHDLVLEIEPHLVIVSHSWRNDRFINFDGPAAEQARRFSRLSSYPLRPSEDIAPTPGSLGSWIGKTLGIPILTLEYRRGDDPQRAWEETRAAILSVIAE